MSYPNYNYGPRFAPQPTPPAFYGNPSQMTQPGFQSAQVGFNGQNQGCFSVQPVTSREEALAVIADPMSPGVLLPDLAHGAVYIKRFNSNTGASDFGEFRLAQPEAAPELPEYVTRADLNAALAQLKTELTAKGGKRKEAAQDE